MKEAKTLYTQISAGKYKGKKLELPSLDTTRSSKSILKESFFDSVQFEIIGKNFVEVFGGSGSIGLEALSRGAKEVYFIEINQEAYQVLKRNTSALDAAHTHLTFGDSFKEYPRLMSEVVEGESYIYFDPPFDIRDGMAGIYEKVIALIASTPSQKVVMIAIEHMTKMDMPEVIGDFKKNKFKKFGRSALTYYEGVDR